MIRTWYIPTWSGDFRLEADGDDRSKLTVVNPTDSEQEVLVRWLKAARKKGWVSGLTGISEKGETVLKVEASIVDAGRVLLGRKGRKTKKDGRLTVVKSTEGDVSAVESEAETAIEVAKPKAEKAVTTRRPTLCCPTPVPGPDQLASEVLRSFCTRSQWEEWEAKRRIHCRGNLSGHLYRVVHRHHPWARAQGKSVWDLEDDEILHCYDWSVPPAEEVLALKNTLEHREHWIRNPSGCLGGVTQNADGSFRPRRDKHVNPFMEADRQMGDGVPDASFVAGFGQGLRNAVWLFMGKRPR